MLSLGYWTISFRRRSLVYSEVTCGLYCYGWQRKMSWGLFSSGLVTSLIEWLMTAVRSTWNGTLRPGGMGTSTWILPHKPHLHSNGSDRLAFNLSRKDLQQNSVSMNACELHLIKLRIIILVEECSYVTSPQWYAWWRSSDVTGSTYSSGRLTKQLAICLLTQDFSPSYS